MFFCLGVLCLDQENNSRNTFLSQSDCRYLYVKNKRSPLFLTYLFMKNYSIIPCSLAERGAFCVSFKFSILLTLH